MKKASGKNKQANPEKGLSRWGQALFKGVMRLPLLDKIHPWLRRDKTDMRWLPINANIHMPENVPMPLELLYRFIEEASHRAIIDYCGCRKGFKCGNYPREIGCLLLGDSAKECRKYPFREAGVEESKQHAKRAVEAGLVPIVGKARVDNFIFGIKDRSRLLTVCFCCECCCITRFCSLVPLRRLDPLFPRLEGVSIRVTDKCIGCGKCVDRCFIHAIEVIEGRAIIDDSCRACGRCASFCPHGAVEISIEDPEWLEKSYSRIRKYAKHD